MRVLVYALLPYVGALAGARIVRARGARDIRLGGATAALAAVIASTSVLGLAVRPVLAALERDADRLAAGEAWRIATPLFVQDAGLLGTVGNVLALLAVGSVAEHLLGSRRMLGVFFGAGILAQLPALAWQPVGAGNSVANFGLAGALAGLVLRSDRDAAAAGAAVAVVASGLGLAVAADIHGPPVLLAAAAVAAGAAISSARAGGAAAP